jgi:hypothetical protein
MTGVQVLDGFIPLKASSQWTGRFPPCSPVPTRMAIIFDHDKVEPLRPGGSCRLTSKDSHSSCSVTGCWWAW